MTKSIEISESNWHNIITEIKKDYPLSVWLSRDKMRRTLGFLPREHKEWVPDSSKRYLRPLITIYLDFFDEKKKTIFFLKYGSYLNNDN